MYSKCLKIKKTKKKKHVNFFLELQLNGVNQSKGLTENKIIIMHNYKLPTSLTHLFTNETKYVRSLTYPPWLIYVPT